MADKSTPAPEKAAGERIAKVLSRSGVASRREAERLIELGEVQVNGKTITSPALNVTAKDRITVGGKPVAAPEPPRLWLYYKPEGLVTSEADEKGRATVFANLPEDMPRVMSVGRLDLNSEGLLLLTNDGELKRRLELPSTGWLRKYRVRVNGRPQDPDLEPLRKGIVVEGETFQAMSVTLDRQQGANAWLTVGLREGKNREIRRAMSAIGLTVNRLIRVSYGPFRLNEMQPGEVEEVKPRVLKDQLGLTDPDDGADPAGRAKPAARRPRGPSDGKPEGKPQTRAAPPRGEAGETPATARRFAAKPVRAGADAPAARPRTAQAGAAKPGPLAAGPAKSGAARPGTAKPGTAKFGTAKSGTAKPGAGKPGASGPGTPGPARGPRAPGPRGDGPRRPRRGE